MITRLASAVVNHSFGAHDPAHDQPNPETMRTRFERSGDYNLDLLEFDAVRVQHRPSGRITLIPFAQCRYVVLAAEEP